MIFLAYFALAMNIIAFVMMGLDKSFAKRGARRIPEKTLFATAALLGGIGGTLGMFVFHHKTRHWYFRFGFPAIAIAEYALLFYFLLK